MNDPGSSTSAPHDAPTAWPHAQGSQRPGVKAEDIGEDLSESIFDHLVQAQGREMHQYPCTGSIIRTLALLMLKLA